MRVSLFVSAMFAASLVAGAAMAERPSDDGGRTSRFNPRESARMHEPSVAREGRQHDTVVRESRLTDQVRNRGDMVDRNVSHSTVAKVAGKDISTPQSQKGQPGSSKQDQVRNCSPSDDTCGSSSRSARGNVTKAVADKTSSTERQDKTNAAAQRHEIQKMVDKVRTEKLMAVLQAKVNAALSGKLANAVEGGSGADDN